MEQAARFELAHRRRHRRALPIELCLQVSRIPAARPQFKLRTMARGGVALPHPSCKRARRGPKPSTKKSGTPPGIRTRKNRFLRPARIPIPPAGRTKTKSPGTLRRTRASRDGQRSLVARRSPPLRARANPPRQTRGLPVAACNFYVSISYLRSPNAALAAALTPPETKNPERSRGPGSGLGAKRLRDPRLRIGAFKMFRKLRVHVQVGADFVLVLLRCQQKFR